MATPPSSTYRIQLAAQHGFDGVTEVVPYLSKLGVTDVYLSPILEATPGSQHGYDVINHAKVSAELGGEERLRAAAKAVHERDMGIVVDVVPNHMAVPTPETLNPVLWSILRDGPHSPYATWLDVDLEWGQPSTDPGLGQGSPGSNLSNRGTPDPAAPWPRSQLILPILGARIDEVLDKDELVVDPTGGPDGRPVLRYYEHVVPVRAGTEDLPLPELLAVQHYRLAYWRVGNEELNYRRFFDIDTLIAIRVELPEVFGATHELTLRLVGDGIVNGLRIDHPDGLADPRGYLRRLADASGNTWVVAEKILGYEEELPTDWPCAGTTGYEAAQRIGGLFVDPAGGPALTQAFAEFTGHAAPWREVVEEARRNVLERVLASELDRLAGVAYRICQSTIRLRDHSRRGITDGLVELFSAMDVYRAYVVPGESPPEESVATLERAAAEARERRPDRAADINLLVDLALGRLGTGAQYDEFCVRFQQTSGPVSAKGVEDTACYRWFPLSSLCEVGGEPHLFGIRPEEFYEWAERRQRHWPYTLNALSTHDTKRSEDVRARLAVLSELPQEWAYAVSSWRDVAGASDDPVTEWLFWQTLVGAWPIDRDRVLSYIVKATREAKVHTSWSDQNVEYESRLNAHLRGVLANDALMASVERFVNQLHSAFVVNCLGQRAIQLLMPGVPDIYAGCETVSLRLVDPDNRTPIDMVVMDDSLTRALADVPNPWTELPAAKLRLTSLGLQMRRRHRPLVGADGAFTPIIATGKAATHVIGFMRSTRLAVLATRLPIGLQARGGWQDTSVALPSGSWKDLLTGNTFEITDNTTSVASLLERWPVALLERSGG
jgi:(1->4)-alpha-D-glucan 1-alpha-D-glucosylmutase